jgi:hypothetical protein
MKAELLRSNQVMRDEFLETIDLLQAKGEQKESEISDLLSKATSFRAEFGNMLEERNFFESEYQYTHAKMQQIEKELEEGRSSWHEWQAKYAHMLGITDSITEKSIEVAI